MIKRIIAIGFIRVKAHIGLNNNEYVDILAKSTIKKGNNTIHNIYKA